MTKISKTDKICAASRLLDAGVDPGDLDRIRTETGYTKRQSEQVAESMREQIEFLRYLDEMDRSLRA